MKELIEKIDFTQSRGDYMRTFIDDLLNTTKGNIVEIGSGFGENTTIFLQVAQKYNRQVLAIDPFETDWENMPKGYQYAFDKFWENVKHYDNLHLHKYSSLHPSCPKHIAYFTPLAFCFIDGLQTKEAVLSDLRMMEKFNPAVICVDDANRLTGQSEVPLALAEFESEYKVIKSGREAFLCK